MHHIVIATALSPGFALHEDCFIEDCFSLDLSSDSVTKHQERCAQTSEVFFKTQDRFRSKLEQ